MVDYKLYYWDVPFRGIFPALMLTEVGAKFSWHDASEIYPEKSLGIHNPGMAPPYLLDMKTKRYLAQMPAILMHLAHAYDYLPGKVETRDLALKTILDCNDVLMEITNYYGQSMWNEKDWQEFRKNRLSKWMKIFEATGSLHHLEAEKGFLLGSTISVADIAVTALFGTMIYSFPELQQDLEKNAPSISQLCSRIEARPSIWTYLEKQRHKWGREYCGGEIERSLRQMISDR
jgi:glutathione S-transferase